MYLGRWATRFLGYLRQSLGLGSQPGTAVCQHEILTNNRMYISNVFHTNTFVSTNKKSYQNKFLNLI